MKAEKQHCVGCRNDHYTRPGNSTSGACSSLKDAKLVKRWRLHWWTTPTTPRAYTEVVVPSCYHQPGQYAYEKTLPEFAVDPVRLTVEGADTHD